MPAWRPQLYKKHAKAAGANAAVVANAVAIADAIVSVHPDLPPVFTLNHLAHLADVDYGLLRAIVSRSLTEPYRVFRIRKQPSFAGEKRFRVICVPDPGLMQAQRWVARNILQRARPHAASVAYFRGNTLMSAAEPHCGCRWLIKLDVRNFFESITEIAAYRVFRSLGYQALVAFELARLCTRLGSLTRIRSTQRWHADWGRRQSIAAYVSWRMGHLPQGAPTSPMLANLASMEFDSIVTKIADENGLVYTRYADDLTLSTADPAFTRERASRIIGQIYEAMGRVGLSPNVTKTRVTPPGARKIVLGLLVDGAKPRLSRDFRAILRRHLYYLSHLDVGPSLHARKRGFASVAGLKNHVRGLISFARQVDPDYGKKCSEAFGAVSWPI